MLVLCRGMSYTLINLRGNGPISIMQQQLRASW